MAKITNLYLQRRINRPVDFSTGYIALASMLVILSVVLVIGTSVSLISISDSQLSLAGKKDEEAYNFIYSCIEEALLKLNEDNTIPTTINVPEGSCQIVIDSQVGNSWTFTTTAAVMTFTKQIQISATRDTSISITSWTELQ